MLFYLALTKILSLKGYWAHTKRVIHVPIVEVAIRIYSEHVSITAVKVTRRQKGPTDFRLTILIILYN